MTDDELNATFLRGYKSGVELSHIAGLRAVWDAAYAAGKQDSSGFYFCEKHDHEQTVPCPACAAELRAMQAREVMK